MSELIGSPVQLAVGQLVFFAAILRISMKDHRDIIGSPLHLRLEQLLHATVPRKLVPGLIPLHHHLLPLLFGEEVHGGERLVRIPDKGTQQHPQVTEHPGNAVAVEATLLVRNYERQLARGGCCDRQRIVGLLEGADVEDLQTAPQVLQRRVDRIILEDQDTVEEGGPSGHL